jgi:hypothetical protein
MKVSVCIFFAFLSISLASKDANVKEMEQEKVDVDSEKLEYAKGSLCGYCDYCKVNYMTRHLQGLFQDYDRIISLVLICHLLRY